MYIVSAWTPHQPNSLSSNSKFTFSLPEPAATSLSCRISHYLFMGFPRNLFWYHLALLCLLWHHHWLNQPPFTPLALWFESSLCDTSVQSTVTLNRATPFYSLNFLISSERQTDLIFLLQVLLQLSYSKAEVVWITVHLNFYVIPLST